VTPDPATIAIQIAAIEERYPDWPRDDQALAEASAAWGGGCNQHGVFMNGERELIARLSGSCKAEIVIAESGNGLFSFGITAEWGMGGCAFAPSVWREPFATRTEARRAAIKELVAAIANHGGGKPTKQQALLLAEVRKADRQRGLFD
jgi:hypothetical protein